MNIFIIFLISFFSCSEPIEEKKINPYIETNFTYHQDTNELYFGVSLEPSLNGVALDSIIMNWFGTDPNNPPFYVSLLDDGTEGDIIKDDNLYSRKVENTNMILNVISETDTNKVYMSFIAQYGPETFIRMDTTRIGNIIPKINSINADSNILRPIGTNVSLHPVYVEVFDPNGLETIDWVGFRSYHVEGDSLMNNGNYIYLYDDGSDVILYEPNFTSGDIEPGDGVYTFRIPVYGVDSDSTTSFFTKPGTFLWLFTAKDIANGYSQIVEHEIVIQ